MAQKQYTEKEKMELGVNYFVDSWFNALAEIWKTERNKKALKDSYEWVSKQAVKVYLEEQKE